jgi:hypothetical protein
VITQVSAARASPGSQISDRLAVTGTGALTLVIKVELFGPFATRIGIGCADAPVSAQARPRMGRGRRRTSRRVPVPVTLVLPSQMRFCSNSLGTT